MYPVTDRYIDTLSRSHDQVGYLEILRDGQTYAKIQTGYVEDPNTGARAYALGGSMTVSRNTIRRSGSVQLLDPSGQLTPMDLHDLFAPYVTEIRPWVGVRYYNARPIPVDEAASWQLNQTVVHRTELSAGTAFAIGDTSAAGSAGNPVGINTSAGDATIFGIGGDIRTDSPLPPVYQVEQEYVPLGTLVVTDIESSYPTITLTGYDRMWYCDQFTAPFTVSPNTTVVDAITTLLSQKVPTSLLAVDFAANPDVVVGSALTYDANSSVADALQAIARVSGQRLYANQLGVFQLSDEATTDDPPVMYYSTVDGPKMLYRIQRTTGGQMYNAVVFTSEATGAAPVRGFALDTNPNSLTNSDRVGTHPYFASSPALITQDDLNKAARAQLQALLGLNNVFSVPIVPNHALDVDDVIWCTDPTIRLDAPLIIDETTIPMRASDGVQTLTCRSNVAVVDQ
jgi:hypothetical protein